MQVVSYTPGPPGGGRDADASRVYTPGPPGPGGGREADASRVYTPGPSGGGRDVDAVVFSTPGPPGPDGGPWTLVRAPIENWPTRLSMKDTATAVKHRQNV